MTQEQWDEVLFEISKLFLSGVIGMAVGVWLGMGMA